MLRTFVKLSAALALVAVLPGCASKKSAITGNPEIVGHEDDLRKLAAFDLGCNEQRLDLMDMGSNNAAVSGCDKKATYNFDGNAWKLVNKDEGGAAKQP